MTSPYGTDHAWEQWGERDPYFAVLSDQAMRRERLTPDALAALFKSGEDHIRGVLETIHRHLDSGFVPRRALDFGCGVGRLLLPLAGVAENVVGVDVSSAMLVEARKQVDTRGLTNVALVRSDDALSQVSGSFDLVHSCLVLQHIPVARGERLIGRLVELLVPGGVAALQVPYRRVASPLRRAATWIQRTVPGVHGVVNLLRGAPRREPQMEMNVYDLGRLYRIFEERGIVRLHCRFMRDGHFHGVMFYAQKTGASHS